MKLISLLITFAAMGYAQAQSSSTSVSPSPAPASSAASGQSSYTLQAPKKVSSNIVLGFKSSSDSGRQAILDDPGARIAKSKNELFGGYRFDNGWGGFYNAVQYYESYNIVPAARKNSEIKSKWKLGDGSVTLLHPDFYESPTLTVFGQLRYYIPMTDRSLTQKIDAFAYYLRSRYKPSPGHSIYNEIIPRYQFNQNYRPTDTTFYVEDFAIYDYKLNNNWKVGAKAWAQYEMHKETDTGYCLEVGPQMTYNFNSNLSISPALYLPVVAEKVVYDGPSKVALDNAYLNIYFQARL